MSIDLDKHKNAMLAAFNDVISEKTKTDWALFAYEGQSNVLKVVGTGEDGVEEMAEDLNSSKIMYAVLRVTDPNTTRPKIVLINWQGEGAPTIRKGTCARHLHDVNRFLRGVHVTVNARTEEEVEPEVVMAAVLKASATTYNFKERSEMNDKTTPVRKPSGPAVACGDGSQSYPSKMPKPKLNMGTNYKRTNPLAEINTKSRNQFWEEQEAEEKRRKTEEQQKREEELKLMEKERKQREIDDAKHRDVLVKERNTRILAERKAEEDTDKRMAAKDDHKWQQSLQSQYQEEQERTKRAEMMRMERKKEAESIIGHRTHSTRAMFESGSVTSEQNTELNRPPPRKLKEFKPNNKSESAESNETASVIPSRGVTARWPPANTAQKEDTSFNQNKDKITPSVFVDTGRIQNPVTPSTVPSTPKRQVEPEPPQPVQQQPQVQPVSPQKAALHQTAPQQQSPPQFNQQQSPPPQLKQQQSPPSQSMQQPAQPHYIQEPEPEPPQPQSVHHNQQQQQHPQTFQQESHPQSNGDVGSNLYNAGAVPSKTNDQDHYQNGQGYNNTVEDTSSRPDEASNTTHHQYNSTDTEQAFESTPTTTMVYEVDGIEYQILPEHGLCARALYDYQAADDTEITFDPEDIITNIDQIDAGWWQGVGPDGAFGLFPANYVELINHPGV